MRFLDFVSVRLAFWLVLGIIIGDYAQPALLWIFPVLISGVVLLFLGRGLPYWHNIPLFGTGVALATTSLGILVMAATLPKNTPSHYTHTQLQSMERLHLKIREVLKPTAYANRYLGSVLAVKDTQTTGKVLLYFPKEASTDTLGVDDELLVFGQPQPISPPLNPYQFNYREYLAKQGVNEQLSIDSGTYLALADPPRTLVGRAMNFRETLIRKLGSYNFGDAELGVIQALLLGQRADISEATYNDYKNAGAVHILAVSGLHVGVLLLLLKLLLQPLERLPGGRIIKLLILVVILWGYALIAGLSPSIVRAVTMFSFVAYALYLNRPSDTANIVTLSLLSMVLLQPLFLFQVGFQMSYAAVYAIVWLYPKLQQYWTPKYFLVRKGWQLFAVSVAAQAGVLPISLLYFHQFPALFFVSNLLVVPFLGVILGVGLPILLLAHFQYLPQFLVSAYDTLIGVMNSLIAWVAQQEAFVFQNISFDHIQLGLSYLVLFGLVFALTKATFRNLVFFLIAVIGFGSYLFYLELTLRKETVILAHQTRNSILMYQHGKSLSLMAADTSRIDRIQTDYEVAARIGSTGVGPLLNSYLFHEKHLVIVDSTGVFPHVAQPAYLLLTQSPRINLDRTLAVLQPQQVIADGSNYRSYVARWEASCRKAGIPFHYTGQSGAYTFSLVD